MAKKTMPEPREVHINVVPLIDLMMCLIIFFLLAAKLATDDNSAAVQLPKIKHVREITAADRSKDRITVNIIPVDRSKKGSGVKYMIRDKEYTPEKLKDELMRAAKNPAVKGELRLVVRPDAAVQYRDLQIVLIHAAQANIKEVLFAAGKQA